LATWGGNDAEGKWLNDCAFDADHIAAIAAAYEKILASLGLVNRGDQMMELIAKKIIACAADGSVDPSSLRDVVASLTGRGIDARGVTLAGPVLSDETIRHGTAYLVELVATAQRGNRFHIEREKHHAH